jgi:alanyl-tRNA synthetase
MTENNHTATHLLHAALREVLGTHVQQKGSLVNDKHLRFDFSHFAKMTDEEIARVEEIVNTKIRENIPRTEDRKIPITQAQEAGAMMLFGEKYGDEVRMITFDPDFSVELCGGCHVPATGRIGLFKIVHETAIAAGVRRIEAVTASAAESFVNDRLATLEELQQILKGSTDILQSVQNLIEENKSLRKELEGLQHEQVKGMKDGLIEAMEEIGAYKFLGKRLEGLDSNAAKDLIYQLIDQVPNAVVVVGLQTEGKAQLHMGISKDIASKGNLDAGKMIRDIARNIQGGGGGQPFFASAGGKNAEGIPAAIEAARDMVAKI